MMLHELPSPNTGEGLATSEAVLNRYANPSPVDISGREIWKIDGMTIHYCADNHDPQLKLCPICDRDKIRKLARTLIEKRGKRGGKIAAKNMTPEQRQERARQAAKARWKKASSRPLSP